MMKIQKPIFRVFLILAMSAILPGLAMSEGRIYYADPNSGNMSNDGSSAKPWKGLAEVVKSGKLKTLKAGDTLLLRSGVHGAVVVDGANDGMITIAAEQDQQPKLSRLRINKGGKWMVRGLTISPSFGEPYEKYIVEINGHEITLEDCFIYSALDSSAWTKEQWMNANSGINTGPDGKNITLRNNFVLNTRFGIQFNTRDSLCEGNVVSDFSADGLRLTQDNQTCQYNVIKNCYVSIEDGDPNHDDLIQCFLYSKGIGLVRKNIIRGNVLINRENPAQPWPAPCRVSAVLPVRTWTL